MIALWFSVCFSVSIIWITFMLEKSECIFPWSCLLEIYKWYSYQYFNSTFFYVLLWCNVPIQHLYHWSISLPPWVSWDVPVCCKSIEFCFCFWLLSWLQGKLATEEALDCCRSSCSLSLGRNEVEEGGDRKSDRWILGSYEKSEVSLEVSGIFLREVKFQNHLQDQLCSLLK